jgi:hypothetical protein
VPTFVAEVFSRTPCAVRVRRVVPGSATARRSGCGDDPRHGPAPSAGSNSWKRNEVQESFSRPVRATDVAAQSFVSFRVAVIVDRVAELGRIRAPILVGVVALSTCEKTVLITVHVRDATSTDSQQRLGAVDGALVDAVGSFVPVGVCVWHATTADSGAVFCRIVRAIVSRSVGLTSVLPLSGICRTGVCRTGVERRGEACAVCGASEERRKCSDGYGSHHVKMGGHPLAFVHESLA